MEEAKKVANENFDWNAFENDLGVYDQPKEQIGEAYDKTLSNIAANEVTEGTVIGINKREVVVNIGYKSEGIIPISATRSRFTSSLPRIRTVSWLFRTRKRVSSSRGIV